VVITEHQHPPAGTTPRATLGDHSWAPPRGSPAQRPSLPSDPQTRGGLVGSAEACAGGVGGPSGGADGRILIPPGSPSTLQHPPAPPRRRPKAHAVKHPGWVGFSSLNRCGHFQHPRKKPSLSPKRGCTQTPSPDLAPHENPQPGSCPPMKTPSPDLAPPVKTPSPKAKQGVEEGKTQARLARAEGQATAPMGGDGQTDRPSRPSPLGQRKVYGGASYSPNSGTKGTLALEGSSGGSGAGGFVRGRRAGGDGGTPGAVSGTSSLAGTLRERGANAALHRPRNPPCSAIQTPTHPRPSERGPGVREDPQLRQLYTPYPPRDRRPQTPADPSPQPSS